MQSRVTQPQGLISVLLDEAAEYGDRTDAAMDLSAFDELEVEEALYSIASSEVVDEDLADHCGESLAEIWCRKGEVKEHMLAHLHPHAMRSMIATLEAQCPEIATRARVALRKE